MKSKKLRLKEILRAVPIAGKSYPDYIEALADRLVSEGVIIPPCKIGDLLYCVISDKAYSGAKTTYTVEPCRVDEINYFGYESFVISVREINHAYRRNVCIGTRAFFTFEEAEAKMNELRGKTGGN